MNLIPISGNTYPVKEQLKSLGARWKPDRKCWMVPADKADQAYALVSNAPRKSYSSASTYRRTGGRRTGCSCGSIEGQIRASDCWTCKHDAE